METVGSMKRLLKIGGPLSPQGLKFIDALLIKQESGYRRERVADMSPCFIKKSIQSQPRAAVVQYAARNRSVGGSISTTHPLSRHNRWDRKVQYPFSSAVAINRYGGQPSPDADGALVHPDDAILQLSREGLFTGQSCDRAHGKQRAKEAGGDGRQAL